MDIVIPEGLENYYAGGIAVDVARKLVATVIDWDNPRTPAPKPFGGKSESFDNNPMETARREGEEEIGFRLAGDGKPIVYTTREQHGVCLFRWDLSSQDFDEQVANSQLTRGGAAKLVHVMSAQAIINADRREFVPYYRELLLPELHRILDA